MGQAVLNIFVTTLLFFIVSFSAFITYRTNKFFCISLAAIFTLSAYSVYFFYSQSKIQLYISLILAISTCTIIIGLIYLTLYKKLKSINAISWEVTIASFGVYIVLKNIISIIWGDSILNIRTSTIQTGTKFINTYITNLDLITCITCILLCMIAYIFLQYFSIGKKLKAVIENKELSEIFGINTNLINLFSFVIAAFFISIAGILVGYDLNLSPNMGFQWLLYGVVVIMIGGMGKIRDILFGSFLLSIIQISTVYFLGTKWMNAITFIVLILFLAWKPYGFSGQKLRKVQI